jgi:hypothetical protein
MQVQRLATDHCRNAAHISNAREQEGDQMLDDERRDAQTDTERCVDSEAIGAFRKTPPSSLGQCEAMLKVLCRDDTLRASYLRRRWQALTR